MKLYHFTFIAHLPDILGIELKLADGTPIASGELGIIPSVKDGFGFMTAGKPVVWLTSRDSLKPTADDLAWLPYAQARGIFEAEEAEHYASVGPIGDRTVCIAVELSNSRRLRHYGTWLRERGMDELVPFLSPSAFAEWWLYLGIIQRERIIEIERTDAPHVNDAERDLWEAMECEFVKCEEVA